MMVLSKANRSVYIVFFFQKNNTQVLFNLKGKCKWVYSVHKILYEASAAIGAHIVGGSIASVDTALVGIFKFD